ncbi:MAG TPA: fenitrothion hydrolase [Solirubrobacterales bacterium]
MRIKQWRWAAIGAVLAAPIAALAFPQVAGAHALIAREDLPIPAWLFAWAASVVLIVSFFALSVLWKQPRFESEDWRPWGGGLSRALLNPIAEVAAGLIGVFLLGVAIWSGLHGTEAPDRNFALTFLFVTCWLGFPLFSVLLGDVFPPFSPWRAIGRSAGGAFRALTGQRPAHLRYPERLGRWPAALGLVAFVWLELIYGAGGLTAGLTPHVTAVAALVYSVYTLAMMAIFGAEVWSRRGETFAVYFNMFSQLSAFEVRDRRIGRRRLFSGATHWATVPGSVALVVASIGTTSFDGAQEGALRDPISSTFNRLVDAGLSLTASFRATQSFYLVVCLVGVAALYLIGVQGMRTVRNAPPAPRLRVGFAHTLIPIAFAYLVAHYFSLFVFQEQAQFTYLLSDPLGTGADIFGTAGSGIDYGAVSATAVWYVQVAALVIGHVCGLTLAHDRAIAYWKDYRQASRSQVWMLGVMVGFTCFGLYLLSQANR